MCGIVGLSLVANHSIAPLVVAEMSRRIMHRGPDSDGYLATDCGKAHVGFRRLAIRDLNPRANQPMVSASGRTAIVFNGEIYNSSELSEQYLARVPLQTSGDTEVILEVIEQQGLEILPKLNGMFAMAIVDLTTGRITLTRDRMGKKPLYVYEENGFVAFSSELRSLKPFGLRANPKNVELYLHFGYFPSPFTFFEQTSQVCPGEIVQLEAGRISVRRRFYRFTDQAWSCDEVDIDHLDQLVNDSVRRRKLSDVPLGAFLSGGVDSALVAANLAEPGTESVPTFTVSFADRTHDEHVAARETAEELALPFHKIDVPEQNLADLATDFVDCYEQPYADTSGLVTMLLCRAVRQHVTVALSGDGGDEFYGGYARYSWFRKALVAQRAPTLARRIAGSIISRIDRQRGRRLSRWLGARDPAELYAEIIRNWNVTDTSQLLDTAAIDTDNRPVDLVRQVFRETDGDAMSKAACFDATYYIPDDLQVKLDRASMQVALEVRCPLLDYRIANAGISLRTDLKYRDGLKTVLKRLLRRHVSQSVLNRPKHGFNVPLSRWLLGPMLTLVEDTFRQQAVREHDWLKTQTIAHVWEQFLCGELQHAHNVWQLFTLSRHLTQESADPLFVSLKDLKPSARRAA